jgi:hypothetical protein
MGGHLEFFQRFIKRRESQVEKDSAQALAMSLLNEGHLDFYNKHREGIPEYARYTLRACLEAERDTVQSLVRGLLGMQKEMKGKFPTDSKISLKHAKRKLEMMAKVLRALPED